MARRSRRDILYDGCFAHVFSRSLSKMWILREPQEFDELKRLLVLAKKKHGFRIHYYCLMNTHFHLVVSLDNVISFSEGLSEVKSSYVRFLNGRRGTEGPLWRQRFKSQLIENEAYLYACGLYVEQNPLKARIVEKSEDWPYSSSRHYLLGENDALVDSYKRPKLSQDIDLADEELFMRSPVIGSESFRTQFLKTCPPGCPRGTVPKRRVQGTWFGDFLKVRRQDTDI